MAEIGLAASIIAVIQISQEAITRVYQYGTAVRNAKEDMDRVADEIEKLKDTLVKLRDIAQNAEASGQPLTCWPTLVSLQAQDDPLQKCLADLKTLQLEPAPEGRLERVIARAQWPLKHRGIEKQLRVIVGRKDRLIEALNIDQA